MKQYNTYFFFMVLLLVSIVAFFIMKPFLMALLLAAILAVLFQGPYRFFVRILRGHERIGALLTALLAVFMFITVFAFVGGLVAGEVGNLYNIASQGDIHAKYVQPIYDFINNNEIIRSLGIVGSFDTQTLSSSISKIAEGFLSVIQKTYKGIASFLFFSFIVFFSMYYLLAEGKALVKKLIYISPLKDSHEKILIKKFISISRATLKGTLVVGMVQGTLGGILFAIVGIPSAVVWGLVMTLLSLIPMVGSSIIWFPAGIILLLMGNIWQGVAVLLVGLSLISLIDNFLRPKLVGRDTQMHPLMVFFATLGGIGVFGLLGFIIGPIIIALFLTLWEIYAVEFKQQLDKYNA